MNKKGDFVISVYWFLILIVTTAAVSYMVLLFYGTPYDVKKIENGILTDKIADCIAEGGYFKEEILNADKTLNTEFNFLEKCSINLATPDLLEEKEQYFIRVQFYKSNTGRIGNLGEQIGKISAGDVNLIYSQEISSEDNERNIDRIVIHATAIGTAEESISYMREHKTSVQYMIDKEESWRDAGYVIDSINEKMVLPLGNVNAIKGEEEVANHLLGLEDLEKRSIGIEVVNLQDTCSYHLSECKSREEVKGIYWEKYSQAQIDSLADVVADICVRYDIPIDRNHILGHEEVDPARKVDPGPLFPWNNFMDLVREKAKDKIKGGREIYVLDKDKNEYIVKIFTLVNKAEKNEN